MNVNNIINKKEENINDNKINMNNPPPEMENKIIEKEKNNLINNEYNNINNSDEEGNDLNYDELTEEEKMELMQQREILMKLQEEAEARGEHFDIQEYLAQLEAQGEEDYEEEGYERQEQNNNKLNKSF